MFLHTLSLLNFRSYKSKTIEFKGNLTIISGPNASGKTNLLESIFMTSTGKSFRADTDKETITQGNDMSRISLDLEKNDFKNIGLDLTMLSNKNNLIVQKRFFINKIPKRLTDFAGEIKTVLFWPQDLDIIIGSPSKRRKYLDFVLSQIDKNYLRSIRGYEKAIRIRNKILEKIRDAHAKREELFYWDDYLIEKGSYISKVREIYIKHINDYLSKYKTNYKVIYDLSSISRARLDKYSMQEVMSATTLVGPHRDDIIFKFKNENVLENYGSRGEQRLAIFWLKLAEMEYIKIKSQEVPILLLDDIFSEFDHANRHLLFDYIEKSQTIITTTDLHLIEERLRKKAQIIQLV